MSGEKPTPAYKEIQPRFGRLLSVCVIAVLFCGGLVWFAGTYLLDCCGPRSAFNCMLNHALRTTLLALYAGSPRSRQAIG